MQAEATKEFEVRVPEEGEQKEADGERYEATQGVIEFLEGAGNLERHDEEGDGEAEDDIGEGVDTRKGAAAETEAVAVSVLMMILHDGDSVREAGRGQN
jgi:hypothetical protein